jgi:hypothetical protein
MLSTAQDYRQGYGGDQQHIWQATLGADAVCFTTHPAKMEGVTPNSWAGSGLLPRAAQVKNVAIVVYKIEKILALYVPIRLFFTHAWLPRDKFDEVIERGGWVFARKGNGYLALRSQRPYHWQTGEGQDQGREMIVEGRTNIWICELGSASEHGSFATFVEKILAAALTFYGLTVTYHSPSQGQLRFGWTGDLLQNDQPVALHHNARYDNPYVQADFPSEAVHIKCGEHSLSLDWNTTTESVGPERL